MSKHRPSSLPGQNLPAGGVILGEGVKVVAHALLLDKDLVEERRLDAEGHGDFLVASGRRWGKLLHSRDVVQFALLAAMDPEGIRWTALAGARVQLIITEQDKEADEKGFTLIDLCTTGDGKTVRIPARPCPVPTELGQLVRAPIQAGTPLRVEVDAPGLGGALVRLIVHGKQAERIGEKK